MADSQTLLYGTDLAFRGDFVVTAAGDLGTMTGLDNLKEAIMRRIFTSPGAIVHRPSYGVGLKSYVNAVNGLSTQQRLAISIQEQLLLDPRIDSITSLSVSSDPNNQGQVTIRLSVKPVGYAELNLSFSTEGF